MHDNFIIHKLCENVICKLTGLKKLRLLISSESYEGSGGVLENCKKCVFYIFKNQEYLVEQINKTEMYLQMICKMPPEVCNFITLYAFNATNNFEDNNNNNNNNNGYNKNTGGTFGMGGMNIIDSIQIILDGVMGSDIEPLLNQTERLKKSRSKKWDRVRRDVVLNVRDVASKLK